MTNVLAELSRVGLRSTPSRVAILKLLSSYPDEHMTAEQIYRTLIDEPGCSVPSVYRTLAQLSEARLIVNTTISEARIVYEVSSKGEHHHLSCIHCGALKNIFEPLLSERCPDVSAELGFTYVSANLVVFGRCETCAKRHRKS